MAGADYCRWRGERCRYEAAEWLCDFHRAFESGDTAALARWLLESDTGDVPKGVAVENVERRADGAYVFTVVALPDTE